MFGKRKKTSSGSGVLASERLRGTMHDQRKLLSFEEQRRVGQMQAELEGLRAKNTVITKEESRQVASSVADFDFTEERDVEEFDLPSGWSGLSDDAVPSLRERFEEEESGLDFSANSSTDFDLEAPLRQHMNMLGSFSASMSSERLEVLGSRSMSALAIDKAPSSGVKSEKPAPQFIKPSPSKPDAGLGFYDFGLGEVVSNTTKKSSVVKKEEVSLVEHIQRRESLRMDMNSTSDVLPTNGGQAASMLLPADSRLSDTPPQPSFLMSENDCQHTDEDISLAFDDSFSRDVAQLETNLSAPAPELDPYDLDFRVDVAPVINDCDADDNIPVLTDIISEGRPATTGVLKSKYGATQSVSILSLLYSWVFSLNSNKRSVAVMKSLEIVNDPHQPNDLEYFSSPEFHGQFLSHSLGKLLSAQSASFSSSGIFHIFRPKLLPSEEKGRLSLMLRDPGCEPFFKWFTPVSPKSDETCVDAFATYTLDKISRSLGLRIQVLWDAARALQTLGLDANPSLRNDVRVMTKVYELTGSMLTPSLLHSLSQSMPDSGLSLQSWLLTHESPRSIDWADVPWGDHPVEVILFHLLGQVASDKRMSLSSLRVLALLDSMLVNTDKMSRYTDSEISVCAVYESHERACSLATPPEEKGAFVGKHLHLVDSEKIDEKLYENPFLEISSCDGKSYISGPFLKTIVDRFHNMHEKLVESGLIRPELIVLAQKMQQID